MNRPLLIRLAPLRWRTALYHRIYRSQRERWKALYSGASLHFAPGVRLDLWPSDEGHSNIAFTGFYELDFSEQVVRLAAAGGLIVDVGANYGYFSLLWASVSRDNRVIAFEASPRNHEALRRNVARNNLESQITVRQVALGRDSGTMPFSLGISEQTGWGGLALDRSVDTVEVPVLTLDETLAGAGMVDLLKVDVEGADTWVLLGAKTPGSEADQANLLRTEQGEDGATWNRKGRSIGVPSSSWIQGRAAG